MLSKDIKIIDSEFIEEGFSSNGVWCAWQRIKTALAELSATPNTQSTAIAQIAQLLERNVSDFDKGNLEHDGFVEHLTWIVEQLRAL